MLHRVNFVFDTRSNPLLLLASNNVETQSFPQKKEDVVEMHACLLLLQMRVASNLNALRLEVRIGREEERRNKDPSSSLRMEDASTFHHIRFHEDIPAIDVTFRNAPVIKEMTFSELEEGMMAIHSLCARLCIDEARLLIPIRRYGESRTARIVPCNAHFRNRKIALVRDDCLFPLRTPPSLLHRVLFFFKKSFCLL